jgi:hypothetical protein
MVAGQLTTLRRSGRGQFIVLAGGGREFRARRAAAGDGEEHWRMRISVLRRGSLTGVDLTAVASYSDVVEGLSHAAHGREAAVDGEHFTAGVSQGRWTTASRSGVQDMGGDDLLTPRSYPHTRARIMTPAT